MFDKIKNHLRENKKFYIGVGVGAGIAGITCLIMRGRHARILDGLDEVTVRPHIKELHAVLDAGADCPVKEPMDSFSVFSGNVTHGDNSPITNIVKVAERDGRGHPGYIIRCKETLKEFPSQKAAAMAYGIPEPIMSEHLNFGRELIEDLHFERVAA